MPAAMPEPRFRPVHDAHAIVEESTFFEFMPPLKQAMPALISLKDELRHDFPSHEILNMMQVQVFQQNQSQPQVTQPRVNEAAGINMQRFDADGTLASTISIAQETVTLDEYRYTRWHEVWPRQREHIAKIFARMSGTPSFMTGVGMRWTDQFIYEGEDEAYDAHELLDPTSAYLHPRAFTSGTRWHCHTGWFDADTTRGYEILNQVNLDAGAVNVQGAMRTAVTIGHAQILRANQAIDELAPFVPGNPSGLEALSALMEALHDGNKRLLRNLLTESMSTRIGLGLERAE
ncbi:hypothetical protein BHAOGJBA_4286 [Methylobacterium hispanicum]|uniref:Uncharacterized protein n=1 Tax=Methylobacterium hispanicum TaxID=270350 RepID=A0AAV4ZRG1_9HYPH|nr:TIGR04255 family protein [Methylobacterium hispanicum]GJD90744.1 hypothetical protein BHAOGJBA_4286 [Methylobacterium hispanicum]